MNILSKLFDNKTKKSVALKVRGIMLGQKGDFKKAIEALKESICLEPDSLDAYIPLAMAYRGNGMLDEAIDALNHLIIKRNSKEIHDMMDFDINFTFATIYMRKGDKAKIIEYAKMAIEAEENPETKKRIEEAIQFGVITREEIDHSKMIDSLKIIIKEYEE